MTYPEIYYSDEVKRILESKPPLPDAPKEPEKVVEPIKPQQQNNSSNYGCGIAFFVISIVIVVISISAGNPSFIFYSLIICGLAFFLMKTFQWDKQSDEKQLQEYNSAIRTFPNRKEEYKKRYEEYQQEITNYNNKVNHFSSDNYVTQFRQGKMRRYLKKRSTPKFIDNNDGSIKKGSMELAFASELSKEFEVFTNKSVIFDEYFEYFPDIILKINNIYIDIEIDEPYSLDDETPIHYVEKDYSAVFLRKDVDISIDENRNNDFNRNGFEVIRFAEEQVCRYPIECINFIKQIVSNLENGGGTINYPNSFLVQKWTKEEAYKMAFLKYRNTYLSNSISPNCDIQDIYVDPKEMQEFVIKQKANKVIRKLTDESIKGYDHSQFLLGLFYYSGKYITKNLTKAVDFFSKAADQGNIFAIFMMGICYENGYGTIRNRKKAFDMYQQAAEQKHAGAIYRIGAFYFYGKSVIVNYEKAVGWLIKSSKCKFLSTRKQKDADDDLFSIIDHIKVLANSIYNAEIIKSYNLLGSCYLDGKGVPKDSEKGIQYLIQAASRGHSGAQLNLGHFYFSGNYVVKDTTKAVEWYKKSAEKGNSEAQYYLGECYFNGHGITQDIKLAIEWYTKSAIQGNANAQFVLGNCYYKGNGVYKDLNKAIEWFQQAAEKGNSKAQCNLGFLYYKGIGVEIDYPKAVEWFSQSSSKGNDKAQLYLGHCYYNGEGVTKDLNKAKEWYTKSACQGNESAQECLNNCFNEDKDAENNEDTKDVSKKTKKQTNIQAEQLSLDFLQ